MASFWNDRKSMALSKICVLLLLAASLCLAAGGPWVVNWFLGKLYARPHPELFWPVLIGGYLCAAAAVTMLFSLYCLLRRASLGEVFTFPNVTALRRISWTCIGAMAVCLTLSLILQRFLILLPLVLAEGFMALIVRVVKNMFEQAVRMREELDLTV